MKKKLSLLFLTCILSVLNINAEVYEGSCGTNVSYSLDTSTGVLNITGTGAMTDFTRAVDIPWYQQRSNVKSVEIADGVTTTGNQAFYNCTNLTSVIIPNGLISIGEKSFSGCSSLGSVAIPNSVTSIGNNAFYGCSILVSAILSNNIKSIGDYTFCGCHGLTSIIIPNSVTIIGERAFSGCHGLTSIDIPNSVISIGNYAFFDTSLSSVTIPSSVTSIGTMGFFGSSIPKVIIHSNAITSKNYATYSTLKDIFGSQVEKYVLGEEITSIGSYAFQDCTGMTDLYCNAENMPNANATAFNNLVLSNATLHVNAESVDAYKATEPWNQFGHIKGPAPLGDANDDGNIDMDDAIFVTNIILGKEDATEAADANQDGEIGMPDVMYIINHNLNGKFPEEKEKSMVLHHSDGTESLIELSTKPLIKFLEDKVQITTNVSQKEYSQDDILSITYKDDETNETNIGIASGTIGEAFYIYRNDGEINGFVRSDVDSIAYSRYDANSIKHSKIVTQIVYTNDSVFQIPLASIDSVSFVTPKTTYQPGVINLSEKLMPYIMGCDSLTISLSASTPADLIPRVGDKLVTTEMNDIFPIGFAGEVAAVNGMEINCKSVLLEEVFETYYNVSSVYGYAEDEEQSSARGVRASMDTIPGRWKKDFKLNTITIPYNTEISRAVKPNSDLALKGGTGFSVELKPTVHVNVMLIVNREEGTYFQARISGNINVKEKLSIYGGVEWSHDIPFSKLRVERRVCPYVNFFFEPGLFIRANALASASVTASQDYSFWWTRDWSSKGRNVIRPSAGGRPTGSSLDIEGCIDGSVAAGGYVDIGLALVHSALDNISLRGEVGAEFASHAMLYNNDIANAEKGTGVYERFRKSSFELNAFVNTSCNLQLAGGLWGASAPLPWNLSVNINTWDVVPTFSNMKFKQKSNDATKADASTLVSGKCLFPVKVGFSVRDDNGEEVESFWDSSSFRNKNRTMSETFSGLSSTGEYTLYPKVKALGIIDMLASPSIEMEKNEMPVMITDFKQTKSEYDASGFNYNDTYYKFKHSCSVTVSLENSKNVEDWGYVYEDLEGNTTLISLKKFSSPYTDSRYVYYRNKPVSSCTLYGYVKYINSDEIVYGEAYEFPLDYSSKICPDGNHPHMIDLGLPSGTKWACCNVGARVPKGRGNYYAWGEVTTKSTYSWGTYRHSGSSLCEDIAGTEYDAATVNWGTPWQMPTAEQIEELINNTTTEWDSEDWCRMYIGRKGGAIIFPGAGGIDESGKFNSLTGVYWSSSRYKDYQAIEFRFSADKNAWDVLSGNLGSLVLCERSLGATIRPVVCR